VSDFNPPPQQAPGLEYAFAFKVNFSKRVKMGALPSGATRGYTGVLSGEVKGPLLNVTIVPHSGGDWPMYWPNGAVEFSANYMLQTDDGTLILVKNRGFRFAPPEVTARMERLDPVHSNEYYMRLAPFFEAPVGQYDWMNRTVFVGTANRQADHSVFRFWRVL
jgi:Protein of unknown function (DUF3237)